MTQVFISYSRKDLAFVEQLAADLRTAGFDVWYDVSGIHGGARWRVEIEKAIRNSLYAIVVLSPDSIASEWVDREFLFASNLKRRIIPLYYRPCELPLNYLDMNYIDVQGDKYRENFDEILRALDKPPASPSEKEAFKPSPAKRSSNRTVMSVILIVIGMAAGSILIAKLFPQNYPQEAVDTFTPPSSTSTPAPVSAPTITPTFRPALKNDFTITFSSKPLGGNSDILMINPVTLDTLGVITDRYHDKVGTWSSDGRYLAYESSHEDPNYYHLYRYDSEQQGTPIPLTKFDECSNWAPVWSPDGGWIVFYSNCETGQREIFIMKSDGSGRKQLTSGSGEKMFPAFSPDGSEITFTLTRNNRDQIVIMKVDGGNQKVVADGCSSTYSPDGKWLWFSSGCNDSVIKRIRTDGTELTTLEGMRGSNPSISPDGNFVVFQSGHDIWVMGVDGSDPIQLTMGEAEDGAPSWKP